MQHWRFGREQLLVLVRIPDHFIHLVQKRLPVRRNRFHERKHVGGTNVIDRRGIEIRRKRHAGERGVTAVASAVNRHAFRIGDAFLDQPLHAIGNVVLHRLAPLLERRFPEFAAVAGRAAEIHLENRITAVCEKLHFRIVAPIIARPRAAMWIHHHRQVLRLASNRQSEITMNR